MQRVRRVQYVAWFRDAIRARFVHEEFSSRARFVGQRWSTIDRKCKSLALVLTSLAERHRVSSRYRNRGADTRIYNASVRDVLRIAFPCCDRAQHRDPMADGAFYGRTHSASTAIEDRGEPEMGQSRNTEHWFQRFRPLLYYGASCGESGR